MSSDPYLHITTASIDDITYTVDGPVTVNLDEYGYMSITATTGNFGVNPTYGINPTGTTTFGITQSQWPRIACQHVISAELAEYIDGTVYSICERCRERVQVQRIPGGLALLAARSLVIAASEGITGDVLGLMKELSDQIEENRESLREMEGLLDVVKQLVRDTYE